MVEDKTYKMQTLSFIQYFTNLISRISAQDFRTVCHLLHFKMHWKHSLLLGWFFPSLGLVLLFSHYFISSESLHTSQKTVFILHASLAVHFIYDTGINTSIIQEISGTSCYHISCPALYSSILYADHLCMRY